MPFAISAGIGVIFGIYPAIRASRLDPIDVLCPLTTGTKHQGFGAY
jgi:hypothetical protein